MWTKIAASMSFLMQALLVVVAVLLFSFFDPFNIFASRKKTLKDTPISISSIKEIGELITAEYYGEVLGSLKDINIQKLDSNVYRLGKLDSSFAAAMTEMRTKNLEFKGLFRKRKIEDYFDANYDFIRSDPFYDSLIEYLKKDLDLNTERQVLKHFYEDTNLKASDIKQDVLSRLSKNKRQPFVPNKNMLKQQIVMLGRGSVKAGYRFDNFNENNFNYSQANNIVYFIGLKPEIFSCNINPWFIPEKKVKGFELILYTGSAKDPKYISEVKAKCVAELRESAMRQDILTKAEINARENLKSFFSLLLDKPVNDIVFMNSKIDVYLHDLKVDGKITNSELSSIDTLLVQFNTEESKKELVLFMDSIRAMPFEFNNKRDTLTCYSSLTNRITADSKIDSVEYANLKTLKENINKPFSEREHYFLNQKDSANIWLRKKAFNSSLKTILANTDKLILGPKRKMEYSKKSANGGDKIKQELNSLLVN
jgi:hypothetical protein